jgi:peptidoglycan LD-endopeptidase LytH
VKLSWPKREAWPKVKPGWILLALLFLYSVVITSAWQRSRAVVQDQRVVISDLQEGGLAQAHAVEPVETEEETALEASAAEAGLWFPVAGAQLPQNPAYLPGAPRTYRQGVNQGFNFYSEDAGVPIPYGAPVIAAADGVVQRADLVYRELNPEEWQVLLADVADGADEAQLDILRGRQIVIETDDGLLLRYAHLSGIRPGISAGQRVYRGQVIGYVGNSGTTEGVRGSTQNARLHFEIWEADGSFFGEGMDEDALRVRAASLFVGP